MKKAIILLFVCSLILTLAGCNFVDKEKDVSMLVYLDEELSDLEAKELGTQLNQLPEVIQVQFVHREDALAAFLEDYENPEAFAGVEADALQHRYEVIAKTVDAEALAERIVEIEGVNKVTYFENTWFNMLTQDLEN